MPEKFKAIVIDNQNDKFSRKIEELDTNSLKDGNLAGAALDVFEVEPATGNRLTTLPNFVATPHMGAQTKEAQLLAANVIAEKIIQVLRGVL